MGNKDSLRNTPHTPLFPHPNAHTPSRIGVKWQLDVPTACYTGSIPQNFYQYTVIDEASRERFIFPYLEQSSYSTVDFMILAFAYFGCQPFFA